MGDGRDVVAAMISALDTNKVLMTEKLPEAKDVIDEIYNGLVMIQKKFYLKTQGGTDKVAECQELLMEVITELNNDGPKLGAKFENFTAKTKDAIHVAMTTVIRMT